MGCCGDKRKKVSFAHTTVRYSGERAIRVLGGTTGRIYEFSGCGSVVSVDNRDLNTVITIPGIKEFQEA